MMHFLYLLLSIYSSATITASVIINPETRNLTYNNSINSNSSSSNNSSNSRRTTLLVNRVFDLLDSDRNGFLDEKEFKKGIYLSESIGGLKLYSTYGPDLFGRLDKEKNKDSRLSRREFTTHFNELLNDSGKTGFHRFLNNSRNTNTVSFNYTKLYSTSRKLYDETYSLKCSNDKTGVNSGWQVFLGCTSDTNQQYDCLDTSCTDSTTDSTPAAIPIDKGITSRRNVIISLDIILGGVLIILSSLVAVLSFTSASIVPWTGAGLFLVLALVVLFLVDVARLRGDFSVNRDNYNNK